MCVRYVHGITRVAVYVSGIVLCCVHYVGVCYHVLCCVSGEDVHVCHCYCVCLDNAVYRGTACITVIVSEILCVRGTVLYSMCTLQCCVSLRLCVIVNVCRCGCVCQSDVVCPWDYIHRRINEIVCLCSVASHRDHAIVVIVCVIVIVCVGTNWFMRVSLWPRL